MAGSGRRPPPGTILTVTVGISSSASFSMRVSSRAHYGLRMMTELAKGYGGGPISLGEVSRTEHLPLSYLEQLAAQLRRGGLVESTRGVHGGYRLTRDPLAVSVLDVVRVLEGEVTPVECLGQDYLPGSCAKEGDCASQPLWQRLKLSIDTVLSQTTLGDLVTDRSLFQTFAPLAAAGQEGQGGPGLPEELRGGHSRSEEVRGSAGSLQEGRGGRSRPQEVRGGHRRPEVAHV